MQIDLNEILRKITKSDGSIIHGFEELAGFLKNHRYSYDELVIISRNIDSELAKRYRLAEEKKLKREMEKDDF